MPVKTWVMLESHDFLADDRIYMPLNLEGASSGGTLRIRGDLLSSPAPPPIPKEELIPVGIDPLTQEKIIIETKEVITEIDEVTLTVPGGTTATIEETQPVVIEEKTTTTTTPITTVITRTLIEDTTTVPTTRGDFGLSFIAPPSAPLSTINVWMGGGATLVYSSRHGQSFDIAVPVNFFQDVPLVESMYESAPITIGGSTIPVSMFGRTFGNPLELGDFGSMFMLDEGVGGSTYPTVTETTPLISTPMLRNGYHACFIEVVTNGNTWRIHVEIEYEYERTGEALTSEEAPIIRNILTNKTMSGLARIGWQTNVKADRNWVTYGIGDNPVNPINMNTVEATTGTLTPYALMTMQDGTFYIVQVFSELKGRTTNSEPFLWKMPDASVRKTADLIVQGNSAGDGLTGDGLRVTDIESEQELTRGRPQLPILPIIAVGGVALLGLGGAAWFMLQRKKT
jgi:hypothetical protein